MTPSTDFNRAAASYVWQGKVFISSQENPEVEKNFKLLNMILLGKWTDKACKKDVRNQYYSRLQSSGS